MKNWSAGHHPTEYFLVCCAELVCCWNCFIRKCLPPSFLLVVLLPCFCFGHARSLSPPPAVWTLYLLEQWICEFECQREWMVWADDQFPVVHGANLASTFEQRKEVSAPGTLKIAACWNSWSLQVFTKPHVWMRATNTFFSFPWQKIYSKRGTASF